MKKDQKKIDTQTKELLKKSILKPSSLDFDDQLMQKIFDAPASTSVKSNGYITGKAWIFLVFAVVLFLFSVQIIGQFSAGYFEDLDLSLSIGLNYVLYGGLILFIPLVFYHFDVLIETTFSKTQKKMMYS